MDKAYNIITRMIRQVYPTGLYLYYTLAAICFVFLRKKRKKQELLLGTYSVIVFSVIIMPFFTLIIWRFLRNGGVYWRLMWLIPYAILIAWAATELIFRAAHTAGRVVVFSLLAAALCMGGTNLYGSGVFSRPTAREKLPQITLTAVSVINENAEKTGNPYKRLCAPVDILCQVRQVDATILQYGKRTLQIEKLDESTRTGYYYKVMNGMIKDTKRRIAKYMREYEMNYIVFPKSYGFMRTLHLAQCEKIYDLDGWQIWYNPHIKNTKHVGEYNFLTE